MFEFLIRRVDGEWFDLHGGWFGGEVLRPNSIPSKPIQGGGDHRIEVSGCEISFSYEDPGIYICFEGGDMPESTAQQVVEEICRNIEQATGQKGRIVRLT